ncbi:hypothetical protein [Nonlabens sp. Asnod3-A02]|uniref:leucine-rich repeat domain-containing protein n=1 Tax=Nonlabens sp. Asnod3-A02 TaxID=3160579 RepID=UPI00386301C4
MRIFNCFIICASFLILNSCNKNLSESELIEKYQTALDDEDWVDALKYVNEGLRRKPEDTALHFSKALCLKRQDPIKNSKEITSHLNIYLTSFKTSSAGRLLKYLNYLDNNEFHKAIEEVNKLENIYGISSATLELRANAQFLNKNYPQAAFNYEELLSYNHTSKKFKQFYYYKIYPKYFADNKEGAAWDTAFLPNYGLEENKKLLERIMNSKLDINDYNEIVVNYNFDSFNQEIRTKIGLQYDNLMRPLYGKQLALTKRSNVIELESLNKDIEILNLSFSQVDKIPDAISKFKKLKALSLSKNKIKDFDKLFQQLAQLPQLEFLSINYSNLKEFPPSIKELKNLKGLSIEASNIRALPKEIGQLKNISYLSVSNNSKLQDLPIEIKYLKKLNALDISGSGIKRIRDEVSLCYNLISIKANASKIETIPNNIKNLKLLKELNLGSNRIKELPEGIGYLNRLDFLLLGDNDLKTLPDSFSKLDNLTFLSLAFNRFKEFPNEVLHLEKLQTLWVHNNNIPSIPKEIGNRKTLTHLLVDHEITSQLNIEKIKSINPNLYVVPEDSRKYVKGEKRKN